jgi:hypothetical protein
MPESRPNRTPELAKQFPIPLERAKLIGQFWAQRQAGATNIPLSSFIKESSLPESEKVELLTIAERFESMPPEAQITINFELTETAREIEGVYSREKN